MDVVIGGWLLVLTGFDLRERRLPNRLTVPPILGGVASSIAFGHLGIAVAMAASATPYLVSFMMGGCGGGDVKLAAGLGAILVDPARALAMVVLASALTVVVVTVSAIGRHGRLRGRSVAHGPAMAAAALVVGAFGS